MKRILNVCFALVGMLTIFSFCFIQKKESAINKTVRFGFYNVENLFDTLDNPNKIDEEFTVKGQNCWNSKRFQKKIDQLAKVIKGTEYPAVMGISEVESAAVMKDFIANTSLAKEGYDFIHYESEDLRGIDCALMYKKEVFKPKKKDYIRMDFPDHIEPGYTSRDILHVYGLLHKVPVHVFINHWPSRYGGLEKSQPKRVFVAQHLRDAVDKILKNDPDANIVIMGDMNDEPDNISVSKTLNANTLKPPYKESNLYNMSSKLDAEGKGSYNYRGNWNMLDQVIVSGNMLQKNTSLQANTFQVFREDWMMYKDKKFGPKPNRTYGGPNYYGGFSDHLPVYLEAVVSSK